MYIFRTNLGKKVIVKMKDELISAVERYDAVVQLFILLCNREG